MKIKTYWVKEEFDIKKHWIKINQYIEFDIPDNSTPEYIADFCKRKDVILIP